MSEKLAQQVGFLERSCDLYDAGHWDEAARLATSIRVLVHTSGRSKSLLTQLGVRETLAYVDTALHRRAIDALEQEPLERIRKETGNSDLIIATTRPEAGLAEPRWIEAGRLAWTSRRAQSPQNPALGFQEWWSTKVIEASDGRTFSRSDIVCVMANQDGGAHVDPGLDADYSALLRDDLGIQTVRPEDQGQDWTMTEPPGGWVSPDGNVAHATVRQVAFEMLATLRGAAELGLAPG